MVPGLMLIWRGSKTTNEAIAGMFWRFLVADDASVEQFVVRDSDYSAGNGGSPAPVLGSG